MQNFDLEIKGYIKVLYWDKKGIYYEGEEDEEDFCWSSDSEPIVKFIAWESKSQLLFCEQYGIKEDWVYYIEAKRDNPIIFFTLWDIWLPIKGENIKYK